MNRRNDFRDRLIGPTVENAAEIPFYRGLWKDSKLNKIRAVEDLDLLPIVDKDLYGRSYEDELPDGVTPAVVSHSTGTTGRMTFRYRSQAEIEFIRRFFEAVQRKMFTPSERIPLIISVPGFYHGGRIPVPGNAFSLQTGVSERVELDQTMHLLCKEFRIPRVASRVTQVHATLVDLKLITFALLARGINPGSLAINALVTTGEYVSSVWRECLERTWDAVLVNRYSLSEVFGGATLCRKCDSYHADTHVVPEVVDPFTRARLQTGLGVLLLTELYPFVQYQPLIRYWTGDLVEAVESDCDPGSPSFRFCGRLEFAIMNPDGRRPEILITPASLHEVLEEVPEVARERSFAHIPDMNDYDLGKPLCEIRVERLADGVSVLVRIGCGFAPALYPERASEIERLLRNRLLELNPNLKRTVGNGTCKLSVEAIDKSLVRPWEVDFRPGMVC